MADKKFTEKEVIGLLLKQRKSDAELLQSESSISGYTVMKKILKNRLVYKVKDAIQE